MSTGKSNDYERGVLVGIASILWLLKRHGEETAIQVLQHIEETVLLESTTVRVREIMESLDSEWRGDHT